MCDNDFSLCVIDKLSFPGTYIIHSSQKLTSRMWCFGDIIIFIEDIIEFFVCIITQSIITCALAVLTLMGSMIYLKWQRGLGQLTLFGAPINYNSEGTGPMPTSTGTSGPLVNQHTTNVPYMQHNKVPGGKFNLSMLLTNQCNLNINNYYLFL